MISHRGCNIMKSYADLSIMFQRGMTSEWLNNPHTVQWREAEGSICLVSQNEQGRMPPFFLLKQVCENTAQVSFSILLYNKTLLAFIILHTSNSKAAAYRHTIPRISITIHLGFHRTFYSDSQYCGPSCGEGQQGLVADKLCSASVSLY